MKQADEKQVLLLFSRAAVARNMAAPEELIHSCEVYIKLVDGCLLEQRDIVLNDVCDNTRVFGIGLHVTTDDNGFRAQATGQLHRHGAVNTKPSGLIAAGSHHSPVACSSDQQGFTFQA